MKQCTKCKQLKDESEFYKRKASKDGFTPQCKECHKLNIFRYSRTKQGVVSLLYNGQILHSKDRNHIPPQYSRQELYEWLDSQDLFHELYNEWVNSDYETKLRPSIDRKDDYKSYSFGNIRLTTWCDNEKRGWADRKNGINNKASKAVEQYDLNGDFIDEYYSTMQAERCRGINHTNISRCCKGKYKTAGGYIWKYKD